MSTSCAQVIVSSLAQQGVDTVFGIPGVHTLELYRALGESDLRHVTPRHEQGAAFMADGFARASGRMAVCCLISGPGLLNAATAIGQAYSDSIPMIVIATVVDRKDLGMGRGRLHEMPDQLATMNGILKGQAFRLNHGTQAAPVLHSLMSRMAVGRPRPAYIEIPLDIASERVDEIASQTGPLNVWRPAAPIEGVNAAVAALRASKRPVFIAGGGATDAGGPLRRLASRVGAVVITTTAGKGVIPEASFNSLGATLNNPGTRAVIDEADLVVAIGTELASPDHFLPRLPVKAPLIRIDLDAEVLVRDQPPLVGLLADSRVALEQIEAALGPEDERLCWLADCSAVRDAQRAELRTRNPGHADFLDALSAALPADAIVSTDMTQIAYSGNVYYPSNRPRTWLHPVGFGTLGYALPAAIGAKLAMPDRMVVALAGDYGGGFTLSELATAADLGMSLPLVIWNNGGLGQIAHDMDQQDIPRLGVDIRAPDFASLAGGYGAAYHKVTRLSELGQALLASQAVSGPSLIEVRSDLS